MITCDACRAPIGPPVGRNHPFGAEWECPTCHVHVRVCSYCEVNATGTQEDMLGALAHEHEHRVYAPNAAFAPSARPKATVSTRGMATKLLRVPYDWSP